MEFCYGITMFEDSDFVQVWYILTSCMHEEINSRLGYTVLTANKDIIL